MISNLPEDNSLYENIISGISTNESSLITLADVSKEYYVLFYINDSQGNRYTTNAVKIKL